MIGDGCNSVRCGICGGQCGAGTELCPSTSVFPYQYHSANAPYSYFIPLPLLVYVITN
jgi:hypothetical protein